MKVSKRLLTRIIKEEKAKLLNEITPGAAGIAAAGGGTPADQGFAAAAADAQEWERNAEYEDRAEIEAEKEVFMKTELTRWYDEFAPQDDGQADLIEDKLSDCYDAIYKELINPYGS